MCGVEKDKNKYLVSRKLWICSEKKEDIWLSELVEKNRRNLKFQIFIIFLRFNRLSLLFFLQNWAKLGKFKSRNPRDVLNLDWNRLKLLRLCFPCFTYYFNTFWIFNFPPQKKWQSCPAVFHPVFLLSTSKIFL